MNNEETIIEATVEKIIKTKCSKCKKITITEIDQTDIDRNKFHVDCKKCHNYYLVNINEKE